MSGKSNYGTNNQYSRNTFDTPPVDLGVQQPRITWGAEMVCITPDGEPNVCVSFGTLDPSMLNLGPSGTVMFCLLAQPALYTLQTQGYSLQGWVLHTSL